MKKVYSAEEFKNAMENAKAAAKSDKKTGCTIIWEEKVDSKFVIKMHTDKSAVWSGEFSVRKTNGGYYMTAKSKAGRWFVCDDTAKSFGI